MILVRAGIPHSRAPPGKGKFSYLVMLKKGGKRGWGKREKGAQTWILKIF